jgi:hypothetical protein
MGNNRITVMTDSTLVSKDRAMKVRSFGIAVVW